MAHMRRSLTTVLIAGFAGIAALAPPALSSQSASVGVGADFVSRYVWRGADFGESFSVQPSLALGFGGFEIGAWGSYSVAADGASANENDLYASFSMETESGVAFSFGLTDYYFPAPPEPFDHELDEPDGDHDHGHDDDHDAPGFFDRGAHFLEPFVQVSGPSSFPVSLFLGVMTKNDENGTDNDLYAEIGIPLSVEGADVGLSLGFVAGESGFYGTDGGAVTNLGVSASKDIAITEDFSLPINVSYVLNPDAERAFLVFGFSLSN